MTVYLHFRDGSLRARARARGRTAAGGFDEAEHPRDEQGRFTEKGPSAEEAYGDLHRPPLGEPHWTRGELPSLKDRQTRYGTTPQSVARAYRDALPNTKVHGDDLQHAWLRADSSAYGERGRWESSAQYDYVTGALAAVEDWKRDFPGTENLIMDLYFSSGEMATPNAAGWTGTNNNADAFVIGFNVTAGSGDAVRDLDQLSSPGMPNVVGEGQREGAAAYGYTVASHELGHVVFNTAGPTPGPEPVPALVENLWQHYRAEHEPGQTPRLQTYAERSPTEFYSECFAAQRAYDAGLLERNPLSAEERRMVREIAAKSQTTETPHPTAFGAAVSVEDYEIHSDDFTGGSVAHLAMAHVARGPSKSQERRLGR